MLGSGPAFAFGYGAAKVEGVAEVGFFDGSGFVGEGQGVWVGGDGDGGDFEEFLLQVSAEWGIRSAE
jgi:hypothetical protein